MNEEKVIQCDKCEYEFPLNAVKIYEANVDVDGRQMLLVYFACPKCNQIYRIALKDSRYIELQQDLEKTKKRIRKNHGSQNVEFARTLDGMVRMKVQRLRNYAKQLNGKFPGTFAFVVSENNHEEQTIQYLP